MVRVSKRMKTTNGMFKEGATYSLQDALKKLAEAPKVKFDETVELHFNLNVDLSKNDQSIRGTTILPNGLGKKIKVVVFAKGLAASKAVESKADHVGAEDLIEKVMGGFLDFDCAIATPDMMRDLSKLGKVLGPRGLMPSPKAGTVTVDVEKAIKDVRAGKIEFKTDKQGGIHVGIGKRSFTPDQLFENANHLIEAVVHAKPGTLKGDLIKSLYLSSTMGPGLRIVL